MIAFKCLKHEAWNQPKNVMELVEMFLKQVKFSSGQFQTHTI